MKQFRNMVYPYVAWIAVMIVAPMLMIVLYAFTTAGNDVTTIRFTLDNFARFFSDQVFLDVLWRSLFIAVITTIICVLVGYPIAYAIAQRSEKSNMFWVLVITMPTWINMMVRTYAWVGILQDGGLINSLLGLFGIGPFKMMYTTFAVVLGMVYNYLPFMILPIYSVICKLDYSLLEAARDLGANTVTVFRKVILPLSLPGVLSGITMVFVPSVSTFAISRMLGGGTELLLGDLIERQFLGGAYNPQLGAAISLVMMLIVVVCMLVMNRFGEGEEQAVML